MVSQAGRHCPGELGGPCVRQVGERRRHLVRFVDDGYPVAVDDLGPAQVIGDGQRYFHVGASFREVLSIVGP